MSKEELAKVQRALTVMADIASAQTPQEGDEPVSYYITPEQCYAVVLTSDKGPFLLLPLGVTISQDE